MHSTWKGNEKYRGSGKETGQRSPAEAGKRLEEGGRTAKGTGYELPLLNKYGELYGVAKENVVGDKWTTIWTTIS